MSRDPNEWRNRPAPMAAYASAASSFFAVGLGVLIVFAGAVIAFGQQIAQFPGWIQRWIGPSVPLAALVLATLSAYGAFQQSRINSAKRIAAQGRKTVPRRWWRRPGAVHPLATIAGGLIGVAVAHGLSPTDLGRFFFDVFGAATGLLGGFLGSIVYLTIVGGYGPPEVASELADVACPGCGEPLAADVRTCPLCGARLGK